MIAAVSGPSSGAVMTWQRWLVRAWPSTWQGSVARKPGKGARHAARSAGGARGIEISLSGFLQDQFINSQIGDRPLKLAILLFQIPQSPGLVHLEPAVLPPPAVVTLPGYSDSTANLPNRLALSQEHLCLAQVVEDLLDRKSLPGHLLTPFLARPRWLKSLPQHLDLVKGGQATSLRRIANLKQSA